jgi:hypothetical protein
MINIQPLEDAKKYVSVEPDVFIQSLEDVGKLSADTIKNDAPASENIAPDAVSEVIAPNAPASENIAPLPPVSEPVEPVTQMTDKEENEAVKRFLFLRDMVVASAFALYLKDWGLTHLFMLTPDQKQTLIAVYKNYPEIWKKSPKYMDLILAELMVIGATFKTVTSMKKNIDAKKNDVENFNNSDIGNYQNNRVDPEQKNITRKFFTIDENGFYDYEPLKYTYVKKANRIKADAIADYADLVSANGEQKIKQIFGL